MLPDRVSIPGPLTYESGALPIALRGPAALVCYDVYFLKLSPDYFDRTIKYGMDTKNKRATRRTDNVRT